MKDEVLIDETTVKRNPDWTWEQSDRKYKTMSHAPELKVTIASSEFSRDIIDREPNVYWIGTEENSGERDGFFEYTVKVVGPVNDVKTVAFLLQFGKIQSYEIDYDIIDVTSMSHEPKLLYDYNEDNAVLECENCGSTFKKRRTMVDEDGEICCPVCGLFIRISYESVDEMFERIENKCPAGYRFGEDVDKIEECDECMVWENCNEYWSLRRFYKAD